MEIQAIPRKTESRAVALAIFYREDAILLSEIQDTVSGAIWHRAIGGGLKLPADGPGETPEVALRREVQEELGLTLKAIPPPLPPLDHIWPWKKKMLHEQAWLFLLPATDYPELTLGQTPQIVEPDGERYPTIWRKLAANPADLPPLSPQLLIEAVLPALKRAKP